MNSHELNLDEEVIRVSEPGVHREFAMNHMMGIAKDVYALFNKVLNACVKQLSMILTCCLPAYSSF